LKDTDLFHPTYFELTPPLEWSNVRTPVVLTVYDFIFARFAHRVPGSERLLALQAMALRRADRLLCISQSTMSDLIERFPECEPRARLTRLGASLPQAAPAKSARPYLIFVGARTFYKNFGWCITAVEHLLSMGEDVELVVAGTPWTPDELPLIVGLAAMGRLRLVAHPDDASLAAWIKGARALLYPSAWEGFGLPALEAIALGTPVVALNASSLPEVVGPGGMLIEPATAGPQALAEASLALLRDSESRERIVRDGLRHAGRFSWEHAAADALAAYEELAA
jgi:mannosyltransferase